MTPRALPVASLLVLAALAGCAEPEEVEQPADTMGFDAPLLVSIDGVIYECDDEFGADDVCDEFEVHDGAETVPPVATVESAEDGTVVIEGLTYACEEDDVRADAGEGAPCEEYELVE